MNEQTTKLIEELALKLGTTTEYLWSVLIHQAFISSIIDCVLYTMYFVFMYYMYKGYKYMLKEEKDEEYIQLVLFLSAVSIVFTIVFILTISSTITGFLNPEYWALEKILKNIK